MHEDKVQPTPQAAREMVADLNKRRAEFLARITGVSSDIIAESLTGKIDEARRLNLDDPHATVPMHLNFLRISVESDVDNQRLLEDFENLEDLKNIKMDDDNYYALHGDPDLLLEQLHESLGMIRAIIVLRIFHGDIVTRENLEKYVADSIQMHKEYLSGNDNTASKRAVELLERYIAEEMKSIRFRFQRLIGRLRNAIVPPNIFSQVKTLSREPHQSAVVFFDEHITPDFVLDTLLNCEALFRSSNSR